MRKILVLTALATVAVAADGAKYPVVRENVGVGLGTLIFENVGDGLLSQTFAATTNGTFGNQTFAITTGTSGAKKWDKIVFNDKADTFVRDNMDVLARDISAGSGETVDALAELLAVPATDRPAFAAKLQANFGRIYTSAEVSHQQVLANIATVVKA
jgi:hypothetical protein